MHVLVRTSISIFKCLVDLQGQKCLDNPICQNLTSYITTERIYTILKPNDLYGVSNVIKIIVTYNTLASAAMPFLYWFT